MALGAPPIDMKTLIIYLNNGSEQASMDLKLTEIHSKILNKVNRQCRNYDEGETFSDCYTNQITKYLGDTSCTLPGKQFF